MNRTKKTIAFSFLVAIFLAAFEGVVISTAAPVIVQNLHDFAMISWIFSIYLLTSAISTPIYGKPSDLYGRRHMLSIGIISFLIGSTCCGLAQSMQQLIIFRGIQGLGAGSILTICFTMIGDIFTLEERAIVQGGVSTMWGVAGLIGPLLGGFLIDYLSWHWIFFINIPFGLICIYILMRYVHETKTHKHPSIDYLGAILLSVAIGTFLYAVMNIQDNLTMAISLLLTSLATSFIFYHWEKRAKEPIVPLFILNKDSIVVNLITFGVSFILIANTVYLPLHIQSIMGYSATIAGLSLVTVSIAWFCSSVFLAKLMKKFGAKHVVMAACTILIASSYILTFIQIDTPIWQIPILVFPFGFAFSGTLNTITFIVQDSVEYNKRGAAVGLNMLTRTLAQTVGIAILGAVVNICTTKLIQLQNLGNLTMQDFYDNTFPQYQEILRQILYDALQYVYAISIGIAIICLILAYFVPAYRARNDKPIDKFS